MTNGRFVQTRLWSIVRLSVFDKRQTGGLFAALPHDGDTVGNTAVVFVENAVGRTDDFGIDRIVGRHEVAACLELGLGFILVERVRQAIGVRAYVDVFGAAAVAFVILAAFQSAFQVFHNVSLRIFCFVVLLCVSAEEIKHFLRKTLDNTYFSMLIYEQLFKYCNTV